MCFTGFVTTTDGKAIGGRADFVLNTISAYIPANPDGYAIRIFGMDGSDTVFRTLDKSAFETYLKESRARIMTAKFVHFHLRKSTNQVSEEFVHLWKVGGYYCSHNGSIIYTEKKCTNDSLDFFTRNQNLLVERKWQELEDSLNAHYGTGVFIMSREDGKEAIAMSIKKPLRLYRDGNLAMFLSAGISSKLHSEMFGIKVSREALWEGTAEDKLLVIDLDRRALEEYKRTIPKIDYPYAAAYQHNYNWYDKRWSSRDSASEFRHYY